MTQPKSWLDIDPDSPFSINNIPFGIISTPDSPTPRPAIAIGNYALDLQAFTQHNGFSKLPDIKDLDKVFSTPTLNAFASLGRPTHKSVRNYLRNILLSNGPYPEILEQNPTLHPTLLIPLQNCTTHLPMSIKDYTDFYAGLHHAQTVGTLFRGPQNALQPNYKHLPVAYHGRASSIVVSGTPIKRPIGQILPQRATHPILSPSKKLDLELEIGCFLAHTTRLGERIPLPSTENHIFGFVLLNDWSARDIQAWEYIPLGPFNGKNFATTISPWVVLLDALEPFRTKGIANDVGVLSYLDEEGEEGFYDVRLGVRIGETEVCVTSARELIFSFGQMIAHHTVGGCPVSAGDLIGSGTISGVGVGEKGCLLERTENGKVEVELGNGERRLFLEDGDTVTLTGVCGERGGLVGFGECKGTIVKADDIS